MPEARTTHAIPLERYEPLEMLGQGTMGTVFAARDRFSGERVAIKSLHPHLAQEPNVVMRFLREAQAMRAVDHPNVARLVDVVRDDHGGCYVMEMLEGESLRCLLERKRLSLDFVYAIAMQVASALEHIHDLGIVHRDIKPDNVFLVRDETGNALVKVLDFGVAKITQTAKIDVTGVGCILGTPAYMAPEQARGDSADARSDIYAFGVVLYEMLCGAKPIEARNLGELIVKLMVIDPQPPSRLRPSGGKRIPARLDALVMQCLAKRPNDRPRNMAEVKKRLLELADAMNDLTEIMRVDEINAMLREGRSSRPPEGMRHMRAIDSEARVGS